MLSHFRHVQLFVTLWTVAHQSSVSMGFSRQEYWSGLPCLSPGDLPNLGTESCLLHLLHWQAGSLPLVRSPYKRMASAIFPVEEEKWRVENKSRLID